MFSEFDDIHLNQTFNKQMMDKFLYPNHPVRCIITGPSDCGKSVFQTNLILKNNNEFFKIYIYSPSLHQVLCQRLVKSSSNYITTNITPKNLNEEDIDIVIEEVIKTKVFQKVDTEREAFDSIEK